MNLLEHVKLTLLNTCLIALVTAIGWFVSKNLSSQLEKIQSQTTTQALVIQRAQLANKLTPFLVVEQIDSGISNSSPDNIIVAHNHTLKNEGEVPIKVELITTKVEPKRCRSRQEDFIGKTINFDFIGVEKETRINLNAKEILPRIFNIKITAPLGMEFECEYEVTLEYTATVESWFTDFVFKGIDETEVFNIPLTRRFVSRVTYTNTITH